MRWIYLVRRSRKYQYVRVIEQCAVPHSHLGQEIHCRIGREKVDEFGVKSFGFKYFREIRLNSISSGGKVLQVF